VAARRAAGDAADADPRCRHAAARARTLYPDLILHVPDKTVRRRRAVLALLVVLSLILISASFASSGGGPLRSVQNGFLDVVSPIESAAGKVLTPVHDLFRAIDDVFNAASQRDKAEQQLTKLRASYIKLQQQERANANAAALLGVLNTAGLHGDGPVTAHVVIQAESLFTSTAQIDVGTGAGVHDGDPVINGQGLVGTVASVSSGTAVVTLVDSSAFTAAAMDNASGEVGAVGADPGSPNQLQLTLVPHPGKIRVGDFIVTAGARQTDGASPLPPGIPIAQVTAAPPASDDTAPFTLTPTVDLGSLAGGPVEVLTRVHV
jgi:rod shape-determining protein MreC